MKRRRRLIALAVVLLCFGMLFARALWEGREALRLGDEAQVAGSDEEAIRWWRRSARWYVPLAPHVEAAYTRLQTTAEAAQSRGETRLALSAWTGIRSSVRATRSFYTPYAAKMATADTQIAVLMVELEAAQPLQYTSPMSDQERRARHYELLQKDPMPSVAWSIVALFGLLLWIVGGFAFALRAVDDEDRLVPVAAAYSGAVIGIGLVVWMTGLYLA